MSFSWADYLILAQGLTQHPATFGVIEAAYRCAIGRSYYAAYCSARDVAAAKHHLTLNAQPSDHKDVAVHFSRGKSRHEQQIGNYLKALRDHRNEADYDATLSSGTPVDMANLSIQMAQRIFSRLQSVK